MATHRIHTQSNLSSKSLVLACAEGLLGELIKNARLGFSDLATEDPLHHTVQLIAAARGYHHHHEYPVIRTKGRGDHKRLDVVCTRLAGNANTREERGIITSAVALEMKVVGRRSRNTHPLEEMGRQSTRGFKNVTKDLQKVRHFLTDTVTELEIPNAAGFLMVVNLDVHSGIRWSVKDTKGIRESDVSLVRRFAYSSGLIHKSVTVYEVRNANGRDK